MFVLELAFSDDPQRLAARPAHRDRLVSLHSDKLLVMAGPFADDSGALLIFNVDTVAELERLLAADPYYRAPGVRVVSHREWRPIVGTG
jgi:uncharacterized protein